MTTSTEEEFLDPVESAVVVHDADHPALGAIKAFGEAHQIDLSFIEVTSFADVRQKVETSGQASHWLLAVEDERLPDLIEKASKVGAVLGFVCAASSVLIRHYSLPKKIEEQIAIALSSQTVEIDLTRCNDEVVLAIAAVGDVPFLDHRGRAFVRSQTSRWRRLQLTLGLFWLTARQLFSIRPTSVTLHIGEEEKPRHSAVTGVVVLEHDADKLSNSLMGERMSACDGRLSAMLVAPTSVVSYLAVLARAVIGGSNLPRALSFIKTQKLILESEQELPFRLDGRRRKAKRICFEVESKALRIKPGESFAEDHPVGTDTRDSLRLRTLPEHEQRLKSISGGLPFFTHALDDDFKDLFLLLRNNARVAPDYLILMVASALLAALGLVLNSTAVIIGAMVLAPLMAPIVSLSMGVLRRDGTLMLGAARAIVTGVVVALGMAALVAAMMPIRELTTEMSSRLHPSILDLAVAVVSGIAAAYAFARENIMKSMPGVAIAVALVPPLAVAGIGIGWWDARVFGGAMLLFLTNLVGIAASAALTFLIMGYAPFKTAIHGLRRLAIAVLLMILPLYFSFNQIVTMSRLETDLREVQVQIGQGKILLEEPRVTLDGETAVIRARLLVTDWISPGDADQIKTALEKHLGRQVRVELDVRLVR